MQSNEELRHWLQCNRCGECCRNWPEGQVCALRPWIPGTPMEFSGTCDLLTSQGDCSVMSRVGMYLVHQCTNVNGSCDFPHLRVAVEVDGDYQ